MAAMDNPAFTSCSFSEAADALTRGKRIRFVSLPEEQYFVRVNYDGMTGVNGIWLCRYAASEVGSGYDVLIRRNMVVVGNESWEMESSVSDT
jgi:hypothetical protein